LEVEDDDDDDLAGAFQSSKEVEDIFMMRRQKPRLIV
jgi:hypothetical protein